MSCGIRETILSRLGKTGAVNRDFDVIEKPNTRQILRIVINQRETITKETDKTEKEGEDDLDSDSDDEHKKRDVTDAPSVEAQAKFQDYRE